MKKSILFMAIMMAMSTMFFQCDKQNPIAPEITNNIIVYTNGGVKRTVYHGVLGNDASATFAVPELNGLSNISTQDLPVITGWLYSPSYSTNSNDPGQDMYHEVENYYLMNGYLKISNNPALYAGAKYVVVVIK